MSNLAELKTCPFCGSDARLDHWMDESCRSHAVVDFWKVRCSGCSAEVEHSEDLNEALEYWNDRV